jgi:hypothetical protein
MLLIGTSCLSLNILLRTDQTVRCTIGCANHSRFRFYISRLKTGAHQDLAHPTPFHGPRKTNSHLISSLTFHHHHTSHTTPSPSLRKLHKNLQQLRIIRRPQPRNWIPPAHSRKPIRKTSWIIPLLDIIQCGRISIQNRVNKPNCFLPRINTLLVDERDDGAYCWGCG